MSTTPQLSPPPATGNDTAPQVTGAGDGGGMDRFRNLISKMSGGGTPLIDQRLQQHHDQRIANSSLNQKAYQDLSSTLTRDADKKYFAPDGSLTPEGQKLEAQRQAAFQAWSKAAGVDKESKTAIQKMGQLADHLVHHRAGGPPTQPGAAPGGGGGLQPPPAASAAGASPAAPAASLAPPPAASPAPGGGGAGSPATTFQPDPATLNEMSLHSQGEHDKDAEEKRQVLKETDQLRQNPQAMYDGLTAPNAKTGQPLFSPEEAKAVVQAKISGAAGRPKQHPTWVQDPNDPSKQIPAVQDLTPNAQGQYPVYDTQGNAIANPERVLPSMLPTATSTSSNYNADTGTTTSSHTSQKVAPKAGGSAGASVVARPGSSKTPSSISTKPGGRLASMAQDWAENGTVPSAKDKPQVEKYMRDNGMQAQVPLIPAAQNTIVAAQPVLDQVDKLIGDIDALKIGDNNTPGYLFGSRLKYAAGMSSPEGSLGKDIAGLSLGSVVEAASVLKGSSRSVLALKKALEHTPNPWKDSPKLMKEKLKTIQDRLKDVVADAYKYGKKGAPGSGLGPPPGKGASADEEAQRYLDSHK